MPKSLVAAVILLVASLQCVHAAPEPGEPEDHGAQRSLSTRLGDTIHQATDRAGELIRNAMGSLGVPYRRGGNTAETGFDCSGFVRATYEQTMGLVLPRRAAEQAAAAHKIEKAELQPGDLVFFNTLRRAYSHVGIYLGEGQFIHSPRKGAKVRVESMEGSYWQKRFNGARRVLHEQAAPGLATAGASASVLGRESPAPTSVRLGGTLAPSASSAAAEQAPLLPAAGEHI